MGLHDDPDGAALPQVPHSDALEILPHVRATEKLIQLWGKEEREYPGQWENPGMGILPRERSRLSARLGFASKRLQGIPVRGREQGLLCYDSSSWSLFLMAKGRAGSINKVGRGSAGLDLVILEGFPNLDPAIP